MKFDKYFTSNLSLCIGVYQEKGLVFKIFRQLEQYTIIIISIIVFVVVCQQVCNDPLWCMVYDGDICVCISFCLEICSSAENPCHAEATCAQSGTDPGYTCTCSLGYEGDGTLAGNGCTGT